MEVPIDRPACGGCKHQDDNLRCELLRAGQSCHYEPKEKGDHQK